MTDSATTAAEKSPSSAGSTDAANSSETTVVVRGGPISRLTHGAYQWVLHWADTPYGTPALAAISFAESSFFPIPPDVLQIALSVARPRRSFFYAAVSAAASVLGGILGWVIGYYLWTATSSFFYSYIPGCTPENFEKVQNLYEQNAMLAILAAAFTPIPYKVFTIAAGIFRIPLPVLVLASAIGRSARFMLVAACTFYFGEQAKKILERHFDKITILFFLLLVLGFVAVKYVL